MPNISAAETGVADGDTIRVNGTIYRLWGIDAPETHQVCADGWPAGQVATAYMVDLVRGRTVECEDRGDNRYRRTVGLCRADGQDLSAAMVGAGMAWAFVRYSHDYVDLEAKAKAVGLGVHAHRCEPAWEWRAKSIR